MRERENTQKHTKTHESCGKSFINVGGEKRRAETPERVPVSKSSFSSSEWGWIQRGEQQQQQEYYYYSFNDEE